MRRELIDWSWAYFEPYYADLIRRPLSSESVAEFLADWTRLSEVIDECYSRLHVATTVNTADENAKQRYHAFLDEVYPRSEDAEQKLKHKLLTRDSVPAGFEVPLLKIRTEAQIYLEENLPLLIREHKLCMEYDKIIGAQTVEWEGREVTVVQLRPVFQNIDRPLRESAWRLAAQRQLEDRESIDALWEEFINLREKLATNAGFDDYRSYRWKQLLRFDYTPEDCKSFHDAIEKVVVPAATRICERRRKLLRLPKLRPWDLEVDTLGRPPLTPFHDVAELQTGVATIFHRLDPELGGYFDTMVQESLLDLDNRKNKAPGGYCTEFAMSKRPFIFMNSVGIHDDVQTLMHESGHAFHTFERNGLPYYQQRQVGMEFSEVASMAMELLASPYLATEDGGFYSSADAARARVEQLERSILFWPFMAVVDAFQHWVYENLSEARRPGSCDAQWKHICERFMPWLDWTGLEQELASGWHRKLHIHTVPFYYVEYGLAQLGAVQVWKNASTDRKGGVAAYRRALALGGTVSLPALFAAAGAKFAFDAATLDSGVSVIEETIHGLDSR